MKYIVCNSENAVFNKMYDELEKHIEDGAVLSLSDKVLFTQFSRRIVDEKNGGKYKYNHIIFLGQKDIANIDIEEESSLLKMMRKHLYKPLGVDYKNIFYPSYFNDDDFDKYNNIISENPIDVALIFLDNNGNIMGYTEVTEENLKIHKQKISANEKNRIRRDYDIQIESDEFIHIGFDNLMSSRNIFLVVLGKDKRKYVENIFENDTEDNKVINYLKKHNNLTVFVDKEASYKSEEEVNRLIKNKKRKQELERLRILQEEKILENE